MIATAMYNFDKNLDRAARILGANRWQRIYHVLLPLIKPGIFSGMTFAFILSFNDVPLALFLVRPGETTLPITVINYYEYGLDPVLAAVNVASLLFLLAVIFLFERIGGSRHKSMEEANEPADVADIELVDVTKRYGDHLVVDQISLNVPKGEFVSILGPSGCGKTTTLNMVAGFHSPSSGRIRIRGRDQAGVPPEKRNIGLVFQNYALFPHMTVAENVAFGLKMKGTSKSETEIGVRRALKSVHLEGYEARYPKELSGGQQQRTALARAIAPQPSVLLLDEPLSNLDLKLRESMRVELKEIQQQLGMTFVYVTHDQEEAMAMSDRVVVMSGGVVAQAGPPVDIYQNPASSFVADFIGKSNLAGRTRRVRGRR